MDSLPKIAIVVPCYNERARLRAEEFSRFLASHGEITFIMVDDGSTDRTAEVIAAIDEANPGRIVALRLEPNQGKAEAVRAGVLRALAADFSYIGYWDADLSTPLDQIVKLRQTLEAAGKDVILGARVRLLGYRIKRAAVRHYLGRIFATATGLLLDLPFYDTQCGAKLFRNTEELGLVFRQPFGVGWIFDVEVLTRFELVNQRARGRGLEDIALECPLDVWEDVPGSKLKPRHFLLAGYELLSLWSRYRAPWATRR